MYRRAALFVLAATLAACGDDTSSGPPPFTITDPGTGEANALPILPMHVGYEGEILDYGDVGIVDGTLAGTMHGGTTYRMVATDGFVQWYLVTDDGVFVAGNASSGLLDSPVLFAPATVRDGMTWTTPTFTFAVTHPSPGRWTINAAPIANPSAAGNYVFSEGIGLVDITAEHLVVASGADGSPDVALPHHPLAADEIALPTDTGGISLDSLSMITRPDGHAILTVGDGIVMLGSQPTALCLTTDGHTVETGSIVHDAPITSRTDGQCAQAQLADVDEGGTSLLQYLSTEIAASAFVRADGTVFYFARMPDGGVTYQDKGSIQLNLGYLPVFFLPGANPATDVPTLVENCTNCITADFLSTMPFDHALEDAYQRGSIPVPWDTLSIANTLPIRDDEGGTSMLILATDGALWSSTLDGPPHRLGRLPGVLSSQARVGGNEVLRVVGDGSVDRLHVSHGAIALEHLGEVALPAGEIAEAAFVWHGDGDGDHLLLFSTLHDDSFLGAHSHLRRSHDPIATGTPATLPPVMQIGEQSRGGGASMICGPDPQAQLSTDGWTVGGVATLAFAQPGTGCVLVIDPPAVPGRDGPSLVEGDFPGLGRTAFALGGGRGTLAYRDLGGEVAAVLAGTVAATPGDTFVGATGRLTAAAGQVDLAHAPAIAAKANGGEVADRAAHGLWIETDAGDLALLGPTTDLRIPSSAGLALRSAIVGGGAVAATDTGPPIAIAPDGTQRALPQLDGYHHVLETLADGTQCGVGVGIASGWFCVSAAGVERTSTDAGGDNAISLADGRIYFQIVGRTLGGTTTQYLFDPATMTVATPAPFPGEIAVISYFFAQAYGPDGSVYAITNTGQLITVDATGMHLVAGGQGQTVAVGEHILVEGASRVARP